MCCIPWYISRYIAPPIFSSITSVLGWFPVVIFPSLLLATLHSVCSPLASARDSRLPLQLRLGDSNPAWLSPAVTPHPNVDLIMPAAVASPIPAASHSSLAVIACDI